MMSLPAISVVVLTHNSFRDKAGCVRHTLAALARQVGVVFEVIVVDNGSLKKDHRRLVAACRAPGLANLDLTLMACSLSIGAARNYGASAARADVIVFLDDDAIVLDNGAVHYILRCASSASHGYGARRLWTPHHPWFVDNQQQILDLVRAGPIEKFLDVLGGPPFETPTRGVFLEYTFPGHFGFVRRPLFDAVGGFPDGFAGYGCEDDAFGLLCYLADPSFSSLRGLRVAHVHHPTPRRYAAEHADNLVRYQDFLARQGLTDFNIDVLLAGLEDTPGHRVLVKLGETTSGPMDETPDPQTF